MDEPRGDELRLVRANVFSTQVKKLAIKKGDDGFEVFPFSITV